MTRIISIVGGMQPTAPTIGTATAGDTTASVAFTASSYIGKGTITYTATSSPGGLTATGASSPLTVTGLTNGTAYTFTVVGNTNYGVASVASAASNSITPATQSSYESIATTTLGSATASVTFTSIPATYTHLQIRCYTQIVRATFGIASGSVQFNSDTGSNYSTHYLRGLGSGGGDSGGTANTTYMVMSDGMWGTSTGGTFGVSIIDVLDYANTSKYKTAKALSGTDYNGVIAGYGGFVGLLSGSWRNTNAITSITFTSTDGNLNTYSSFALYGIKGV
jgi:hypothetical protein